MKLESLLVKVWIIGLPYDTEETVRATFDWLARSDCPLDSFSVTSLSISPSSAIGQNMARYGYSWDENGQWYSEWMTEEKAKELTNEFRYSIAVNKPRTRFQFTYFGRMQNIGWTLDDFDNFKYSQDESEKRKEKLKDTYYEKLVNL